MDMDEKRIKLILEKLKKKLKKYDFCGTIIDDAFHEAVTPKAADYIEGLLTKKEAQILFDADEYEEGNGAYTVAMRTVVNAFIRYLQPDE
jgi:hypothetical protein